MKGRLIAIFLVVLLAAGPIGTRAARAQISTENPPDTIGEGYQAIYFKAWNQLSPRQQALLRTYFDHSAGSSTPSTPPLGAVGSFIDQNRLAREWSRLVVDHNDWAADFLAVTQALGCTTIDLGSGGKMNALEAVKGIDSLHGDRLYTIVDPAVFQQWRDAGGGFSIATADGETETGKVRFDRGDLGGSLHRGYDLQWYTSVSNVPRIQWNYRAAGSLADTDLDAYAPWKDGLMPNPRHRTYNNSDPRQWLPSYIRKYGDPGFTVRKAAENVAEARASEPAAPSGLSPELERQALDLAQKFSGQVEQKKDFGAVVDQLFASDFLDRYLKDADNYPLTGLARDLAAKIDPGQLRQYYVGLNNLYNLNATASPAASGVLDSIEKALPAGLTGMGGQSAGSASNPAPSPGGSTITNSAQFQAVLATIEKSVSALQANVSPEIAAQVGEYLKQASGQQGGQQNTGSAPAPSGDLLKPWAVTCDRQCFGFPTGTELIAVNVPYHQLLLARIDGHLKIISAIPLASPSSLSPGPPPAATPAPNVP